MNDLYYVICLENEYSPHLIPGKIYKACHDENGEQENLIRVFGEMGEGLLFHKSRFKTIELSEDTKTALEDIYAIAS